MVRSNFHEQAATSTKVGESDSPQIGEWVYFDVPFNENGTARAQGLKWDSTIRRWFAPSADIAEKYRSLIGPAPTVPDGKIYFNVHFLQKDQAKQLGMLFDGTRKKWFARTPEIAACARKIFYELSV